MWEPYDPVSYFTHVIFGFLAVAGAITALIVRKGSPNHRRGGWTFTFPMAIAALTAVIFEIEFDEPRPLAIMMSAATLYLLTTGILALRNTRPYAPILEKALVIIPMALFALSVMFFARSIATMSLATIPGPALYAGIFLALIVGDIRLFRSRPDERIYWIRRHLFRMILAFAFAIRALFAIGIETGLPFEIVVTTPLVLALIGTWYFFRKLGRKQLSIDRRSTITTATAHEEPAK